MRALAQEDRYPAVRRVTDIGRAGHRGWLAEVFATQLEGLAPETARQRLDALVAATDVYVWKLLRRDLGRPLAEVQTLIECFIRAALGGQPSGGPT